MLILSLLFFSQSLKRQSSSYESNTQKRGPGSTRNSLPNALLESAAYQHLLQNIKSVKPLPARAELVYPVYVSSCEPGKVMSVLEDPSVYKTGIFKRVLSLSNTSIVLAVLTKQDHYDYLKKVLQDIQCTFSDTSPFKSTRYKILACDFTAPLSVQLTNTEIAKELKHSNSILADMVLTVDRSYTRSSPKSAVISFYSQEDYLKVKAKSVLSLWNSTPDVFDFVPVDVCVTCSQLGHKSTECIFSDLKICLRCASTDHVIASCSTTQRNCFNCIVHGHKQVNHMASAVHCPHRLAYMSQLASTVVE